LSLGKYGIVILTTTATLCYLKPFLYYRLEWGTMFCTAL